MHPFMTYPWDLVVSRERRENSAVMWTYSHGFEVPIELLGDRVRKTATSDRDAILRPTQGGDLH